MTKKNQEAIVQTTKIQETKLADIIADTLASITDKLVKFGWEEIFQGQDSIGRRQPSYMGNNAYTHYYRNLSKSINLM